MARGNKQFIRNVEAPGLDDIVVRPGFPIEVGTIISVAASNNVSAYLVDKVVTEGKKRVIIIKPLKI